ncbi:MAG: prepilin-type N-terminal cleavage/methylation domain-containing protein [Rhodospirillales bacterium]
MTKAHPRSPDAGFTLLEVLIAFALVAFVLAAVMQVFSGGMRITSLVEQRVVASMLAQSKLTEMGANQPLVPGVESGISDAGYRWTAEVQEYLDLTGQEAEGNSTKLYQLTVVVEWGPRINPRTLRLTTLHLGWPKEATEAGERS